MEHGAIDLPSAHAMIAATAGTDTVPMVRIAANVASLAKPLLDAGAMGVAVPMVCTREEAETAASALRYPPLGSRMWGPFYAPLRWNLPMQAYMRAANDSVLSMITIEHPSAVDNIKDIVLAHGTDVAIIGPGDMATSMGHFGQVDHPDVQSAMKAAEDVILKSNVALGGVAYTPDHANQLTARGYRMVFLGFDWSLLQRGCSQALAGIDRR
jgi:4-hydroxy-2-oxoheptanedioate aldolase